MNQCCPVTAAAPLPALLSSTVTFAQSSVATGDGEQKHTDHTKKRPATETRGPASKAA